MSIDAHEDLGPLERLLGTWSGNGHGIYPTISPFDYDETVTFSHVGKPYLIYRQRTTAASDGRLLHAEGGYLRMTSAQHVELVLAHPNGLAEVSEGDFDGHDLTLVSSSVARTTSAKEVTAIERNLHFSSGTIDYVVRMAAMGQPMQEHLRATLRREAS